MADDTAQTQSLDAAVAGSPSSVQAAVPDLLEDIRLGRFKRLRLAIPLVIFVFAIVIMAWGIWNYTSLQRSLDAQNACQAAGVEMRNASDYLTDQARRFATTGDPENMSNYFTEAKVTQRRNNALQLLGTYFTDTPAYAELQASFAKSIELMDTEYYSMRLMCEAIGLDESQWPDEVKAANLTAEDQALSADQKQDKALDILLDAAYHEKKDFIDANAQSCTNDLLNQAKSLSDKYEQLMLCVLVVMFVCLVVMIVLALALLRMMRRLEKSHERLQEAKAAADESSAAKTRFLFNMSHDIRTPMNAVIGFSELLEKHRGDDKKFAHDLEGIRLSGDYMLDIVNNVLDMARIESGKLKPEVKVIDLAFIDDRVEAVFRGEFDAKKLDYHYTCDTALGRVHTDPALLSKAVLNLIGNAVKYTPEGGSIFFDMKQLPAEAGRCVTEMTIKDTGIGMSKDFVEHAFDAFERERNTTASGISGTGLGLGIVKGIVDSLGGTVSIESEPGVGTCVFVRIPMELAQSGEGVDAGGAGSESASESAANDGKPLDLSGRCILIAEDNDFNAEILTDILAETGVTVERACDGVECVDMLDKADAGYYNMVLMDIQMPNLDGHGATRLIRTLDDANKAGLPIVAVTANAFDEDRANAKAAGMNDLLAKPIDVKELTRIMKEYLG